jgi:ParB-like chromosome segregation protein Spo0J
MPEPVKMAFERQVVVLPLSNILPIKRVPDTVKQAMRYKRIVASIAEVGIVEPLVVARRQDDTGPYMLVDGHLRHAALSDPGNSEAPCLIADDDEAFTYNKRVNRLATIQEHYMIVKAIERGFPRRNSPGRSMSTSGGSRPSGHCSTGSVPKSPSC